MKRSVGTQRLLRATAVAITWVGLALGTPAAVHAEAAETEPAEPVAAPAVEAGVSDPSVDGVAPNTASVADADERPAPAQEASTSTDPVRDPFVRPGVADRRLHLALRTTLLYYTLAPALGGSLRLAGYWPLWSARRVTGSLDLGLLFGWAYGGKFIYPWIEEDPDTRIEGSDQNFTTAVSIGHTFFLGKKRRSSLGAHAIVGLNVLRSSWSQTWLREDLSGRDTSVFTALHLGLEVDYQFRISRRVGVNALLGGTCPCLASIAGNGIRAGAGVTVYLR